MLYILPLSPKDLGHFAPTKKYKCHKVIETEHQRDGKEGGANVQVHLSGQPGERGNMTILIIRKKDT